MAGGSRSHSQIALNLGAQLVSATKGTPRIPYGSDARIEVERVGAFLYPDLSVVCGDSEESLLSNTIQHPILIVEVLSESTAVKDFGVKFLHYQQIDRLEEYVLVDQFSPTVHILRRKEDGDWGMKIVHGLHATIKLQSLGISIPLSAIYDRVIFPETKEPVI